VTDTDLAQQITANLKSKDGHTLRPYQREFIETTVVKHPHVATFDEMGVGKTVQCIAADQLRRAQAGPGDHKTLVVAPLSGVIDQWVEEFQKWTDLRVKRINAKSAKTRAWFLMDMEKYDVFIIHPEGMRIEKDNLTQVKWLHMVFDEVHRIKNRKTKTAQAAVEVGQCARYRTGATGTPMENMPAEMWHILKWLYPKKKDRDEANIGHWTQKLISSYWRFRGRFVQEFINEAGYPEIIGTQNEEELRKLFGIFYIRRLKTDVQKDLPPKIRQTYEVDLPAKQRKAYDEMKNELIAWVGQNNDQPVVAPVIIAQLTRLQQFTLGYGEILTHKKFKVVDGVREEHIETQFKLHEPSVKLDALMDILDDLGDQQCVVFTSSKQAVMLAKLRFEKAGIGVSVITGDVTDAKRNAEINRFKRGETQVFIATIRSGGVGLNLQNASTVVFLDRDWSPAKNQQAEDRCHRGGQTNPVHIIDIVARKTIDQKKDRKLQLKWSWLAATIGV
jgi:SNF2 family DNA or RNA helicase